MSSRVGHRKCSIHNIPRHYIEPLILHELQTITAFAREREVEFIALVENTHDSVAASEMRSMRSELEKAMQRVNELDLLIKKIYEDNIAGRILNERFQKFYADYEAEQAQLKARMAELTNLIASEYEKNANIARFLEMVKKFTDISELTSEIVRIFIDKVVVHQANGRWGKNRRQQIDIYYNFIGLLE